jgi:hypothetical protein
MEAGSTHTNFRVQRIRLDPAKAKRSEDGEHFIVMYKGEEKTVNSVIVEAYGEGDVFAGTQGRVIGNELNSEDIISFLQQHGFEYQLEKDQMGHSLFIKDVETGFNTGTKYSLAINLSKPQVIHLNWYNYGSWETSKGHHRFIIEDLTDLRRLFKQMSIIK